MNNKIFVYEAWFFPPFLDYYKIYCIINYNN